MESYRMLKDIAAVKFAVEICNDFDIKKEILCAPGSENYWTEKLFQFKSEFERKKDWSKILEKNTIEKLKSQSLPKCIEEKITGLVFEVGMKMLCWAQYHEGMFGLSRERSVVFLNSSFFTPLGIIDNKKAAEQLMNEESLSIEQKYRLACIYCFTDQLSVLFKQIPQKRKKTYYNGHDPTQVTQSALIKFWSYYLMGKIDLLKGEKNLNLYYLENAVKSGNVAAVEYCFKLPNLRKEEYSLSYIALAVVRSILKGEFKRYVFELEKYDVDNSVWIPQYFYTDIICFLLSKMEESEKIIFFKEDIWGISYKDIYFREKSHSNVLEYFLDWPYQWYFVDTEKLVREFLPPNSFAILLQKICNKIENVKELNYGEEKCFDYRNLLREFWLNSLDCCKKYILQDNKISKYGLTQIFTEGKDILNTLFTLKNFTYSDQDNILLILNYATYDERKNIISSYEGEKMCFQLMCKERWEVLDKFVLKCFFCKDETEKFKKDLIFTEEAKSIVIDFIENNKLDAIQFFIDWISLSEEELVQYKEEIIFSHKGRRAYMDLVFKNGDVESADKFRKLLVSSEKVNEFKKTLLSDSICYYCYNCTDVFNGHFRRIENFLQWATSSINEIKKFKKELIYENMEYFFERTLMSCNFRCGWNIEIGHYVYKIWYNGSDWISVEKLLTWCLSSEKEILEFKKVLLERFGVKIHFQLIRVNQWAEAETFFAWLGLNIRDIQKLKKKTIFENIGTILVDLKDTEDHSTFDIVDYKFSAYGRLQDRLELLLRWCLCDRESVLEFKSLLEERFAEDSCFEEDIDFTNILNNFSLAIEEYLIDLEPDHLNEKRKSEVLSPKKTCKKCLISEYE